MGRLIRRLLGDTDVDGGFETSNQLDTPVKTLRITCRERKRSAQGNKVFRPSGTSSSRGRGGDEETDKGKMRKWTGKTGKRKKERKMETDSNTGIVGTDGESGTHRRLIFTLVG